LATEVADEGTLDVLIDCAARSAEEDALRLVLTGEMGGGKTAACVLLIVALTQRQSRLPVLFQLAAWDPDTSLQAWMAHQLPDLFPVLGRSDDERRLAVILAERHILPVLDGLDEMLRPAAALQAIEDQLSGQSFVLTCRTDEFAAANADGVLHGTLIAQLQSLDPAEVRSILLSYEPPGFHGRLEPLVAELADKPGGPLSQVLSTPFMVSLARDSGVSLPELMSTAKGPDAEKAIRRHLLSTFVQRAYAGEARVTPDQARRYLRFLARHTDMAGRLAWWQLCQTVPRPVFFVIAIFVAGVVCSGAGALFFNLFGRPWLGFWIGLGAGVVGAVIDKVVPQDDPRRARPHFRSVTLPTPHVLARLFGFGLVGAATTAVIVVFLYKSAGYVVIGAALSALTFAVARYVSQPSDPLEVVTPDSLLRADRATVVHAFFVGAVPGALTGAYLGLAFRAGHRASLGSLAILHYSHAMQALLGAVGGCVLSGIGLGLLVMGSSAWGALIWTRIWLAAHGLAPLRLMSFLDDAYRRGILRQVSGYYEFRHRIMQDYLGEPGPGLPGAVTDDSAVPPLHP
jgi:hypothetical protein